MSAIPLCAECRLPEDPYVETFGCTTCARRAAEELKALPAGTTAAVLAPYTASRVNQYAARYPGVWISQERYTRSPSGRIEEGADGDPRFVLVRPFAVVLVRMGFQVWVQARRDEAVRRLDADPALAARFCEVYALTGEEASARALLEFGPMP